LELEVLLRVVHQSVMVLIQYFQLLHQLVEDTVDHIEQPNKQVDLEVEEHQDNLQVEHLVIHLLSVLLKEILGVMEQVKDQFHLELVEVVEVQPLQGVDLLEAQEHLILLLGLT
jgi:hypothetical protein